MIIEFRGYVQPESNETIVWRYMDFTKFTDLLSKKSMFFLKSSKFEDPFEGIYPTKITEGSREFHKKAARLREFCYVNCWHMSQYESAAMWRLYLSNVEGVAIKTTSGNLKKAFAECEEEIFISKVKYWDFENGNNDDLYNETKDVHGFSTVNPVVFKRHSFEHEKELRLIYNRFTYETAETPPQEYGVSIKTNLEYLIDEIHIAPYAPDWFTILVKDICEKFEINKPIYKSQLYAKPDID